MSELKKYNVDIEWGGYSRGTHSCVIEAENKAMAHEIAREIQVGDEPIRSDIEIQDVRIEEVSELKEYNVEIEWSTRTRGVHTCQIMAKNEDEATEKANEIDDIDLDNSCGGDVETHDITVSRVKR